MLGDEWRGEVMRVKERGGHERGEESVKSSEKSKQRWLELYDGVKVGGESEMAR